MGTRWLLRSRRGVDCGDGLVGVIFWGRGAVEAELLFRRVVLEVSMVESNVMQKDNICMHGMSSQHQ